MPLEREDWYGRKRVGETLRCDPSSGVVDLNHCVLASAAGPDHQVAAGVHRLLCVDEQVQQHLFDRAGVHPAGQWHTGEALPNGQGVTVRLGRVEVDHVAHQLIEVHGLQLQVRLPDILEKTVEDLFEAVGLFLDDGDLPRGAGEPMAALVPEHPARIAQIDVLQGLLGQLEVHLDRGQRVLDLVGQLAGQSGKLFVAIHGRGRSPRAAGVRSTNQRHDCRPRQTQSRASPSQKPSQACSTPLSFQSKKTHSRNLRGPHRVFSLRTPEFRLRVSLICLVVCLTVFSSGSINHGAPGAYLFPTACPVDPGPCLGCRDLYLALLRPVWA